MPVLYVFLQYVIYDIDIKDNELTDFSFLIISIIALYKDRSLSWSDDLHARPGTAVHSHHASQWSTGQQVRKIHISVHLFLIKCNF